MSGESRPKPLFFLVLGCVILGLVAYGFRGVLFPKDQGARTETISLQELSDAKGVEAADANVPKTVKEYVFKPSEKLGTHLPLPVHHHPAWLGHRALDHAAPAPSFPSHQAWRKLN